MSREKGVSGVRADSDREKSGGGERAGAKAVGGPKEQGGKCSSRDKVLGGVFST